MEHADGASRRAIVLVVDDNEDVRRLVRRTLTGGYDVIEACDGREAVAAFAAAPEPPALVITDVRMPGKDGFDTILEIKGRDPSVPIIAVSGGGRTSRGDYMLILRELGAIASLEKPFDLDALRQLVDEHARPAIAVAAS